MILLSVISFVGLSWACEETQSPDHSPSEPPQSGGSGEEMVLQEEQNSGQTSPGSLKTKEASASRPPAEDPDAGEQGEKCAGIAPDLCAAGVSLLGLLNQERHRVGVPPLEWNPVLAYVAHDWSQAQGRAGKMSHEGFPLERERVMEQAFPQSAVDIMGENVAYGQFPRAAPLRSEELAQIFYKLWKESPGHYQNMISPQFEAVGMGFSLHNGRWYGTQVFGKKI